MVAYRRYRVAVGTYFFTVALHNRASSLLVDHITELRAAFRVVKSKRPFRIDAMVVMPEHLHAMWTLPPDDHDYPGRWRAIKSGFTRALVKSGVGATRNKKGEYDVWQRRYWEHTIRDENDAERVVNYIHYNPVKHGYVNRVNDWPYSTFHRYVRLGIVAADWAGNADGWRHGVGE